MQCMVTAPIPLYSPNDITRAQSHAGDWIASFDFDGAITSTPSLPIIASTNESLHDSSTTTSTLTGPFCFNHQYSVTAITTSTGAIAQRYANTAYGQPTILNASGLPLTPQSSTLNSRCSYTGREWDAPLGSHHFRARRMSPSAGRFLGRDPIGYIGREWDQYAFLNGRTFVSIDQFGEADVEINRSAFATSKCGGFDARVPFTVNVKQASTKSRFGLVSQKLSVTESVNKCRIEGDCCVKENQEFYSCVKRETFGFVDLSLVANPAPVWYTYFQSDRGVKDEWSWNSQRGSCGSTGNASFYADVRVTEATSAEINRFINGFNYDNTVLQCGFMSINPPPLEDPSIAATVGKRLDENIFAYWDCCDGKGYHFVHKSIFNNY